METKHCGLPLGNVCDSVEMQDAFNCLLTKIDEKIHDVALQCTCLDDKDKNFIILDLNHLRCDVMALQNTVRQHGLRIKCNYQSIGELKLAVAKAEQRLDVAFNSLRDVENKNIEQDDRLQDAETKIGVFEEQFVAIKTSITEIEESLVNHTDRISALESSTDELKKKDSAHDADIAALQEYVKNDIEVTKEVAEHLKTIDEKDYQQDTRLGSLEAIADSHTTAITEVNEAIDAIGTKNSEQDSKIESLESVADATAESLSELSGEIGEVRIKDDEQNTRLDSLEATVGDINTKDTQQDTAISALQDSVGTINTELTTVDARLESLEDAPGYDDTAVKADIAALKEKDTALEQADTALDTRVTALEDYPGYDDTDIKADIAALKEKDTALEQADTALDTRVTVLENTEQPDVTELTNRVDTLEGETDVLQTDVEQLKKDLVDGIKEIVAAVNSKGKSLDDAATIDEVAAAITSLIVASGNATPAQVLAGATFSNTDGESTGTMTDRGQARLVSGRNDYDVIIPDGYYAPASYVDVTPAYSAGMKYVIDSYSLESINMFGLGAWSRSTATEKIHLNIITGKRFCNFKIVSNFGVQIINYITFGIELTLEISSIGELIWKIDILDSDGNKLSEDPNSNFNVALFNNKGVALAVPNVVPT